MYAKHLKTLIARVASTVARLRSDPSTINKFDDYSLSAFPTHKECVPDFVPNNILALTAELESYALGRTVGAV